MELNERRIRKLGRNVISYKLYDIMILNAHL